MLKDLRHYQNRQPLIAILRGLQQTRALQVAELLLDAGFEMLEVPLNSPQALHSIEIIANKFGRRALIGAGTVTDIHQVDAVAAAGGRLIVSPNCNSAVIQRSKQLGLISLPGCVTPTEIFAARDAGADGVKLFPATMVSPTEVAALRAVLPAFPLFAVGGAHGENFAEYLRAGASGFGIGSGLFRPEMSLADIRQRASQFVEAMDAFFSTEDATEK